MASLESHPVPKHYPDRISSTDHSLRRDYSDEEPSLDQTESPWPDEVDLDELYYKSGPSIAPDLITPEEFDVKCVASLVSSHENKHRSLGLEANTAPGPMNRISTSSDIYRRLPTWSTKTRTDILSLCPQK